MDCRWFAHCRITQNSIDHLHIKYSTNTTNTIHIYIFVILYHRYWRALKPKTCTQLWDVFWIVFARSRVSTNYKIKFSLQLHLKFENLNNHLKQKNLRRLGVSLVFQLLLYQSILSFWKPSRKYYSINTYVKIITST